MRKVIISNATNYDWEDICRDSTYIYIGDFGNVGSRTDLKIYRLSVSSYLTTLNDTVTADTIQYSYSDQTDFTPDQFNTNYDAEALISYNDSLYIFTKNWGNYWTNIYALPKTPGTYQISKVDSLYSEGLVTGATYNSYIISKSKSTSNASIIPVERILIANSLKRPFVALKSTVAFIVRSMISGGIVIGNSSEPSPNISKRNVASTSVAKRSKYKVR